MNKLKVVYYMKEYATNKKIKDLLMKINPLLTRKVNNIRIHIESLKNGILSEEECKTIEAKMELGKLCLRLEEMNPNSFATLLFYVEEENKIYHGAAPNIPLHNFEFFHEINKNFQTLPVYMKEIYPRIEGFNLFGLFRLIKVALPLEHLLCSKDIKKGQRKLRFTKQSKKY